MAKSAFPNPYTDRFVWQFVFPAIFIFLATGCGQHDSLHRVIVNGTVTFNGRPLQTGQIRFIPDSGSVGPVTIEPILGGKYHCERSGGLPVGNHRVEILAFDADDPEPTGPGGRPRRQLIPSKYNHDSQLHVNIPTEKDVVVKDFVLAE